jgi:hypothetical protein
MKTFRQLILEATGLRRAKRLPSKIKERALTKFALKQGVRAAAKVGSGTVVPPVDGVGGKVSSSEAILAQFGANVFQDPKTGEYSKSKWTPTEDMALTGKMSLDPKLTSIIRNTFVQRIKQRSALGSSHNY